MNLFILRISTLLSILISLVSCAPANPRIGEGSSASLHASPEANLTFPNWPSPPFLLRIADAYSLAVYEAEAYPHSQPQPSVPLIRNFIREFGDNLAHTYPPPALPPKTAGQTYWDLEKFSKWEIKESTGLFHTKMPTAIVVGAIEVMSRQVRSFGPPKKLKGVIWIGRKMGNDIVLTITPLGQTEVLKGVGGHSGNFTSTA